MKKKILLITMLSCLLSGISCFAIGGTTGDLIWDFNEETGVLTISGEGEMPDYSTNSSPSPWYHSCNSIIKEVIIEEGVTNIGKGAFFLCFNLTSVKISNSVGVIGASAFENCHKLTSITIPDSVTSIGNYAFSGCIGLISIILPNSVTNIGSDVFYFCTALTSVTLPENLNSISPYIFGAVEVLLL